MKKSTLYVLLGALLLSAPVAAQTKAKGAEPVYPTKPIRFVIAFTPGGPSDILSRLVGTKLSQSVGQPVVFDNRPGAGGNIAGEIVAKSVPDGHTLMIANNGVLAANATLYKKMTFNPAKELTPVVWVASQPNILVVHPSVPVNSVKELIAYLNSCGNKQALAVRAAEKFHQRLCCVLDVVRSRNRRHRRARAHHYS